MADQTQSAAKTKVAPVKLIYDVWLEEDLRTPSGTVLELPLERARELIDAGKAERADPLPGESR
ncbi:hypothetical protein LAC81_01960 [Ensifer adhaerens]|uniref:hypothetical protein n=1 Tax=Ensifer adhaerens TaxID=106592 RepID=UPI001CC161C9|nr:hypothetical protein [Ensifer adhaerens]MBZ7920551.1 hypothetical protein [Ensifer adhaerens]UAX93027.1 hypothetical protein LAC78_01955 [Ensifer adhaerens]UAY00663.1 hypothetical protein LAC80_01960 [Ensifer adhaerens]UAY08044.1 hypothetical protein LAC81_01960 [Ensifer adhaerens]